MNMPSVEDIIRMREDAILRLLEEKEQLQQQLEELHAQIDAVEVNLKRLGYTGAIPTDTKKLTKHPLSKSSDVYTLEMLLEGKDHATVSQFNSLSEKVKGLGPGINTSVHKKYAAFSTTKRNFCEVVVWVSKLTIYVDIPLVDLKDPEKIAEDCSTIGRWATGKTRFQLSIADNMEYAMNLISQSFQYNNLNNNLS